MGYSERCTDMLNMWGNLLSNCKNQTRENHSTNLHSLYSILATSSTTTTTTATTK